MPAIEFSWGGPMILALGAVALGGLVHGTLGIGFPLVATPIIALATDVKTAIILTLAPTIVVNIVSIAHGGRWGESLGRYWPVAGFMLLGSSLGTRVLIVSDPIVFKPILAAIILIYLRTSSINALGWVWIGRHPRLSGIGFGSLAGLLAGTVNVAVPILIIYFTELRLAPVALVQILNLCFFSGKVAQVATFALAGLLSERILLLALPLTLTASITLSAGIAIRRRVHTDTYRRWLRGMLVVMAGVLIVQFLLAVSP